MAAARAALRPLQSHASWARSSMSTPPPAKSTPTRRPLAMTPASHGLESPPSVVDPVVAGAAAAATSEGPGWAVAVNVVAVPAGTGAVVADWPTTTAVVVVVVDDAAAAPGAAAAGAIVAGVTAPSVVAVVTFV